VVAAIVLCDVGWPVFFRQVRPGRHARPFALVKFRRMRAPDPARGLATDADRLTATGRLLRAASLDELPTLWNVIRGELSLVGPRPLLMSYLDHDTPDQARRHDVPPRVTGLAQVRGRKRTVLRREGVTAADSATAPEFRGTAQNAGRAR